jgi:hypothetical protein
MTSLKFENVMCTNIRNNDVCVNFVSKNFNFRKVTEGKEKQPVVTSKHLMKINSNMQCVDQRKR